MKVIMVNCLNCGEKVEKQYREVKRGNGKFCSYSCASSYNTTRRYAMVNKPNVTCAHCGCEFYKSASKIKNSKSGLHFCCRKHKDLAQRIGGIEAIQPDHYGTGTGVNCYRKLAFRTYDRRCMRCGYDDNPAAIVVHHKDLDRTNNNIDNLEVLCCNCHAIEHWGGPDRNRTDAILALQGRSSPS